MIVFALAILCFFFLFFFGITIIVEAIVLRLLKWGNIWHSIGTSFLMNSISLIFILCRMSTFVVGYGENAPLPEPPSDGISEFTPTWFIITFLILVFIEGCYLWLTYYGRKAIRKYRKIEINPSPPKRTKVLAQIVIWSFSTNFASYVVLFLVNRRLSPP